MNNNGDNSSLQTMYFIVRAVFLFGLVFLFATIIPRETLHIRVRSVIALIVVVIYSLIDTLWSITVNQKRLVCKTICSNK